MTQQPRFESVGWAFFGIVLAVLLAPCIYLVVKQTNEAITIGMRVGTGVVLAFFAAAFLSWAVNTALQFRAESNEEPEAGPTKTAKAQKKKKKR